MKFFRQLAAVLVLVAAVVALGVAWEHSSEAGWVAAPRLEVGQILPGSPGRPAGFDPSDAGDLARTAEIEAAVVAAVVALDLVRRVRRRRRTGRVMR